MSSNLSLLESKNELLSTMSQSDQDKYFHLLQLWFQQKINKTTYDTEMTKLLNKQQNELHNKFFLLFFHRYVKFDDQKYSNLNHSEQQNQQNEYSNNRMETNINTEQTTTQLAQSTGHCDKKIKISHKEMKFEPFNINNFLPIIFLDYDTEMISRSRENYLFGLIQIKAWQEGLFNGAANKEILCLINHGIHTFIKNIITQIVMQKKSYKIQNNKFICDIGKDIANPWLESSNLCRTQQSVRYPLIKQNDFMFKKICLLNNDNNYQTAIEMGNSIKFDKSNKSIKSNTGCISEEDVLNVVLNNINNVIPVRDLQYILYEKILPLPKHVE